VPEPVPEFLDALRTKPSQSGILTDFDGTIAKIVDEPADARPLDGVPELLDQLAGRYAVVAVLSGRPVTFLARWLPSSVVLSGLYGLEVVRDGVAVDNPNAAQWRAIVGEVFEVAHSSGPEHMRVEHKGLSLTLHFRGNPEIESEVHAFAQQLAERSGLSVRTARMSVELHPPVAVDKGTALRELTAGLEAVCYMGDDVGDLPAFRALDELAAHDVSCVRIGVRSEEAPSELLDAADVVVDGPEGVRDLLAQL
jgi:trehalose 6-phosphate phosphatase